MTGLLVVGLGFEEVEGLFLAEGGSPYDNHTGKTFLARASTEISAQFDISRKNNAEPAILFV